ncbi:SsgA family sporulation/cell division regulator [Kitasatospora sp. NPDC004289]
MDTARTVAHRLSIRMPDSAHPDLLLPGRLVYDSADPYAVELVVADSGPYRIDGPPVRWSFARELLDQGRRTPAGLGDVLVASGPGGSVLIELRGGVGVAVLSVPGEQVKHFLEDSYALVPPGEEALHLDVDGCLARLLW